MTATVQFVEVPTVLGSYVPAGGGEFVERAGRIVAMKFRCPCGCGALLAVVFTPDGWSFTGPRDRPTVTPGMRNPDGCRWSGQLVDGEYRRI